jgi:hypothetical protein
MAARIGPAAGGPWEQPSCQGRDRCGLIRCRKQSLVIANRYISSKYLIRGAARWRSFWPFAVGSKLLFARMPARTNTAAGHE